MGVLAPPQRLLVHRHGLVEQLLVGVQHREPLVDAQADVHEHTGRVVGLAVDIGGQVPLLDEGPVGAGPQVKEDVEEVGCLEADRADHLEPVLLEDGMDSLPHPLQGSPF